MFQSTRPVRGATLRDGVKQLGGVSIHAPRAGRDDGKPYNTEEQWKSFNPRAPCGARHVITNFFFLIYGFNPRAPCGARLVGDAVIVIVPSFQSTRPVRGATCIAQPLLVYLVVSIHAPRAGRDLPTGKP